jgi:DNA-binding NarL/FixJ family response regulator
VHPQKRILIADGSKYFNLSIWATLIPEATFKIIGLAGTASETVKMAASLAPDIILIDLSHSAMGSLQTIKMLNQIAPGVPIVTFMPMWLNRATWSDEYSRAVLHAGATVCLTKSDLADVLLQTLLELSLGPQTCFEQTASPNLGIQPLPSTQNLECSP